MHSDKAIFKEEDDRFQRFGFSKRIATSIIDRKSNESIVIGIYGAWGEGKTSVLNFIESELSKDSSIVTVKFNPWRYKEEDELLRSFFKKIAESLQVELYKKSEKFGEIVEKYGKLSEVFGVDISGAGSVLANVDIESLKGRVDLFLNESKIKLVIIIDDIDRLDKQEIYSIFRIVKLNADFANTSYILSFDEEMVASAIGERYGSGSKQAGVNFLEKIIQVPLRIPQAQPDALKKHCFQLLEDALNQNEIILEEEEAQRFAGSFSQFILPRLETPRLAVRYSNAIAFSLSLVKNEVNHVDLLLIDAVKIFYPKYYQYVKENPEYFIGAYKNTYDFSRDDKKIKEIEEKLGKVDDELSEKEKRHIKSLLSNLFPRLNEAFGNRFYSNESENDWYRDKRIVSPKYFNRYFSYAVLKGDISDVAFEEFISKVQNLEKEKVIEKMNALIDQSSPHNFVHKLRSLEDELKWEDSKKLIEALSLNNEKFPQVHNFFSFGYDSPKSQLAIFILQLLKKHENVDEVFEVCKNLMKNAQPFDFAYELNNWFRHGERKEDKLLSNDEQYNEIAQIMIERALKEAGEVPIFVTHANYVVYLLGAWSELNRPKLLKYLKSKIDKDKSSIVALLRAFTPTIRSTAYPEPYKKDFSKDQYDYLKKIVDVDFIYKLIEKKHKALIEESEAQFYGQMENKQTDENIVRQFIHWYLKDKES